MAGSRPRVTHQQLGGCDYSGPCEEMRQALRQGLVQRIEGKLYLGPSCRLEQCIIGCRSKLIREPANMAAWPWSQLKPLPVPNEAA